MAKSNIYMNKKDIIKVIDGIIKNSTIVAKTYGYSGHDICVRFNDRNTITNDGVSVSNNIFLENELEEIGSAFVRDITLNSDISSNDGTTASAILTKSIMTKLKPLITKSKNKDKSRNMINVKKGMSRAVEDIENNLKLSKTNIDINNKTHLYNVAYTATRDEYLSNILSDTFHEIGVDGKVLFKEKEGNGIEVEYKTGFILNYGYSTPMLPNVLSEPNVLLYNERINSTDVTTRIIQSAISVNCQNLVIFAKDGVADLVMSQLIQIQNNAQINLNINVIKLVGNATKVKREIKDLSLITGAKILDNSSILNINEDCFGKSKSINISEKQTTIVDGEKNIDELTEHLKELQKEVLNSRSIDRKDEIKKRIANINGKVAIIKIGGLSRERIENYKDKIRDSVGSIKNAIDEGVVKGGGAALLNAYKILKCENRTFETKEESIGYNIVLNSLLAPIQQILENSYEKRRKIIKKILNIKDITVGYDAKNNEITTNLYSKGIIDPYLTVLNSLKNAVDLCSLFTNLDGFIVSKSEGFNNE